MVQKKFCISLSFPLQNADFEQVLVPLQKLVEGKLLSFDKILSDGNLKTVRNGFVSSCRDKIKSYLFLPYQCIKYQSKCENSAF